MAEELRSIDVAAYYRMSSEEQTLSIAQQQKEVREYAKRRGWRIVQEYVDSGKSGSREQHKRVAFRQMVADSTKGEWNAILCYDSSRFGRLDTLDSAEAKRVLRDSGIHLETVREGTIDWSTPLGRLQDAMLSESNHEYSVKISGSSMRGRLFTVEQGYWPHGAVPFGYDKQYIEGNEVRMVVPRTKEFRKPRNWKLKLIVNEAEAKTVKWLFDEFAHKDTSMRQLGIELTKRGIPTPQGGMGRAGWTKQTVHDVLSNPAYCGDIAIGHHRRRQKKVFTRATPTIKKDAVPAIVDRETWKQVQLKFQKLQATARKAQPERSSSLSGVLVCGHCGYRMVKKERLGKVYYTCAGRFIRPGIKCSQWRAHEDELLPVICKLLVENIDFEILQKLQSKPSEQDTGQSERLQKQTAELEAKIRRGSENLLLATPELFPEMQRQVLEWKAELLKLQNTITLSESQTDEIKKWVTWWESVRGKLVVVSEMEWGNPQTLRQPVTLTRKEKADIIRKLGKKAGTVSVDGQTYELDSEGEIWRLRQVEEPVQPAIMAEPAVLRDLLHKLNCTVTLHWKPNGKRFFTLEKGILRAEFGEYYLDGRSNKCTHACTPDKD